MREDLEQAFQAALVCARMCVRGLGRGTCVPGGWGEAVETLGEPGAWLDPSVRGPGRQAGPLGAQALVSHSEEFRFPGKGMCCAGHT